MFLLVTMLHTLALAARYANEHPGTASQATAYFLRPTAEQLARFGLT